MGLILEGGEQSEVPSFCGDYLATISRMLHWRYKHSLCHTYLVCVVSGESICPYTTSLFLQISLIQIPGCLVNSKLQNHKT